MKNQVFIAMMVMASLLFIATGASARGPSWLMLHPNQDFALTASVVQGETQEFVSAASATHEDKGEMVAAGATTVEAAKMSGVMAAREWAGQFNISRDYCNYCSIFTGLP